MCTTTKSRYNCGLAASLAAAFAIITASRIGSIECAAAPNAKPELFATADGGFVDIAGINDGVEFEASLAPTSSNSLEPCSMNAPDRNECIRNLFEEILPKLKLGLPEYNMGSVDPYFYKRGIFRYASDGIQGGLLIKNMEINGISALKVNTLLSNFTGDNFIIKLGVELPKLNANGNFKADVKFGGLRLVPKGPFDITITDIKAVVLTNGSFVDTEQGKRVKLQRLNANVGIKDARIVADGIFSDPGLNTMILNLVNNNILELARTGIPATRDQWAPILVEHINSFFENVPLEKFLF